MTLSIADRERGDLPVTGPARVLIVDDHPMIRRGLQEMLRESSTVEVVGQAETLADCVQAVDGLQPDVVLLDINLGADNGFDVCAEILRRRPATKVIFLSAHDDEAHLCEAVRVGGSGYLLKGVHAEPLVNAIERVRCGETVIDPEILGHLPSGPAGRGRSHDWPGATRGLTRRESEVLHEMAQGLDNRHIARLLFISEETVKSHVKAVLRKLQAGDRVQGVVIALRDGIVR